MIRFLACLDTLDVDVRGLFSQTDRGRSAVFLSLPLRINAGVFTMSRRTLIVCLSLVFAASGVATTQDTLKTPGLHQPTILYGAA